MQIIGNFGIETYILYFLLSQFKKRPTPLGKRASYEKDFVSRSCIGYALSLLGKGECCCGYGERVCSSSLEVSGDRG